MSVQATIIDGIPSYLDQGSAVAIAANMPASQVPAFLAANEGQQSAALAVASLDVDSAGPYQGRHFNPNNQTFQGQAPSSWSSPAWRTSRGPAAKATRF